MKLNDWVSFLCLIVCLLIMWRFRQILLLIFTAVVLSIVLNSWVRRVVNGLKISHRWAVLVVLVSVLLGASLLLLLAVPQFISQFQQLLQQVPAGFDQFGIWIDDFIDSLPDWLSMQELETPDVSRQLQQIVTFVLNFFSNSFTILLKLVFVTAVTVMLLVDPAAYRRLILRLFPSFYRRRADEILTKCEAALLHWIGGVSFNSIFVASLCGLGLWALQVEFTFTHAILAGVFNFVPNIGPFLSVVFPLSVALLDSFNKAIAVVILYVVVQNMESYWFSPAVMLQQVSLLPAATLIAQIFFATFFGLLGLILALPLAVVTKTWVEEAWVKDVLDRDSHRDHTAKPT
ncbi:MAG: AI-2E family transporter [Cyanobacteria bacterium P01_D01_bin.14]